MEQTILIIALLVIIAGIGVGVWLIQSSRKNSGIHIDLDKNAGITVTQHMDGIHFDIYYDRQEDQAPDYCLYPELDNDVPGSAEYGREFWAQVADLESLPQEQKDKVVQSLIHLRFITKEKGIQLMGGQPPVRKPSAQPAPAKGAPAKEAPAASSGGGIMPDFDDPRFHQPAPEIYDGPAPDEEGGEEDGDGSARGQENPKEGDAAAPGAPSAPDYGDFESFTV